MLAQPRNPYYERGYKADLQVGVSPARNYIVANSTLTTSHGYCFGNGLFVGGGTGVYVDRRGIDMKKARILLPVYGEVTYSFMNRMASPLIGVRGGALSDYTIRGAGFFVRPYIGVNIWRMTLTAGIEYLSMGYRTEVEDIRIESLVPEDLRTASKDEFLSRLSAMDDKMRDLFVSARAEGKNIRYVGKVDEDGKCSVGLELYPDDHPFSQAHGTDNVIAFTTERYFNQPLVIKGPGAGPEVTAAGVFADMLRLGAYLGSRI